MSRNARCTGTCSSRARRRGSRADQLDAACHQRARGAHGERDEVGVVFPPLQQLRLRVLNRTRVAPSSESLSRAPGDETVGVDRVHQRGPDEPVERYESIPARWARSGTARRRACRRDAHGEGGGVRVIARLIRRRSCTSSGRRDDPRTVSGER